MAKGDHIVIQKHDAKYFIRVLKDISKELGGKVADVQNAIGISDSTYYSLLNDEYLTKATAQKIMDAHKTIVNYKKVKPNDNL